MNGEDGSFYGSPGSLRGVGHGPGPLASPPRRAPPLYGGEGPDMRAMSLGVQAKLASFQNILDSNVQLLKQLRREIDGKQEQAEASRMNESILSASHRMREFERVLDAKADAGDIASRLEEVVTLVSKTMETSEINVRFSRCATKSEIQAELAAKASSTEVKTWMTNKADCSEVDGMFERQSMTLTAMQAELEAAVAGEMEARRQSNALLRDSLVQEIHSMRVGMEQNFAKKLDDTRRELETSFQAKVDSAVAREMRARESAVQTLKDDFRAVVSASEESTQSALAAEAKKRAEGDGGLREHIKETQGSVLSETRLLLQAKVSHEEQAVLQEEISEVLTKKVDHGELELLLSRIPNRSEFQSELNKKPSVEEMLAAAEVKADRADVKEFFERQTQAWSSVQERVDTGLASEAEARRKGDANARELIVQELDTLKHELEQRTDGGTAELHAELLLVRESVEQETAIEARSRAAAMDALRKAVHEELKGLERGVEASLSAEHDLWREYEALLPRLERQVAQLKEDMRQEQESRNSLGTQLHSGLDAISQEVSEAQAELTKAEKQLRADVDHTIVQLSTELRTTQANHDKLAGTVETKASKVEVASLLATRPTHEAVRAEMDAKASAAQVKAALEAAALEVEAALDKHRHHTTNLAHQLEREKHQREEALRVLDETQRDGVDEQIRELRKETEKRFEADAGALRAASTALGAQVDEAAEIERRARRLAIEAAARESENNLKLEVDVRKKAVQALATTLDQELKAVRVEVVQRNQMQIDTLTQAVDTVTQRIDNTAIRVRTELDDKLLVQARAQLAAMEAARLEVEMVVAAEAKAAHQMVAEAEGRLAMETRAARQAAEEMAGVLVERVAKEERARGDLKGALETKIHKEQSGRKQAVEEAAREVEAKAAAEERSRAAGLDALHTDLLQRLQVEHRAREGASEALQEMLELKCRQVSTSLREEVERCVRDVTNQVASLDTKLGTALVEEEIKTKDLVLSNLRKIQEKIAQEYSETSAKMEVLAMKVEEKADVDEVTDHLIEIKRSVDSKVDKGEARKVVRHQKHAHSALSQGFSSVDPPPRGRYPSPSSHRIQSAPAPQKALAPNRNSLSYNLLRTPHSGY